MANYAKFDAKSRNLVGRFTYLVFNPGAGMVGKFKVSRLPTTHPSRVGGPGGGTCPAPKTAQSSAPEQYCPPLYTTGAIALTSTVSDMQRMWRDLLPSGFGPVEIPTNSSSTCAGTSGQQASVLNYLHQSFSGKELPNGTTGITRFSDGSTSEYRVVNAGSHRFAHVPGSNYDSASNPLTDSCAAHSPEPAPQKTPGFSLPNKGRLSKGEVGGGGLGAQDVLEKYQGQAGICSGNTCKPNQSFVFERTMKSIWEFEHPQEEQ
jgi:hypothetical protein